MNIPPMMSLEELRRRRNEEPGGASKKHAEITISKVEESARAADSEAREIERKVAAGEASYRLKGLSGTYRDAVFPIDSGEIVLGRDKKTCHIIFPSNTRGVSRRHCALKRKGATMYLMDLGSSNGTYISDADDLQLIANVEYRLPVGQEFYLASGREQFRLELAEGGKR